MFLLMVWSNKSDYYFEHYLYSWVFPETTFRKLWLYCHEVGLNPGYLTLYVLLTYTCSGYNFLRCTAISYRVKLSRKL
jgi:hypothetical protein